MFVSSVITTHFQLLYTIKRLSLLFTPNGTPVLPESTRSILNSNTSLSLPTHLFKISHCCSRLYLSWRIPCFKMVAREALLAITLMTYWTNINFGRIKFGSSPFASKTSVQTIYIKRILLFLSLPYNKHLINRAKSLCMGESWRSYAQSVVCTVVCTDLIAFGLYLRPRLRFSHTDFLLG